MFNKNNVKRGNVVKLKGKEGLFVVVSSYDEKVYFRGSDGGYEDIEQVFELHYNIDRVEKIKNAAEDTLSEVMHKLKKELSRAIRRNDKDYFNGVEDVAGETIALIYNELKGYDLGLWEDEYCIIDYDDLYGEEDFFEEEEEV